jgi:hypothetical protein
VFENTNPPIVRLAFKVLVTVSGNVTEPVLVKLAVSAVPGPPVTLQLALPQLVPPVPFQVTTTASAA